MSTKFAPNTAALETPKVEGEAIGFFKVDCMISPDTESPIPAKRAARRRGRRICWTMRTAEVVPSPNKAMKDSGRLIWEEPTMRPEKNKTTSSTDKVAITMVLRRIVLILNVREKSSMLRR